MMCFPVVYYSTCIRVEMIREKNAEGRTLRIDTLCIHKHPLFDLRSAAFEKMFVALNHQFQWLWHKRRLFKNYNYNPPPTQGLEGFVLDAIKPIKIVTKYFHIKPCAVMLVQSVKWQPSCSFTFSVCWCVKLYGQTVLVNLCHSEQRCNETTGGVIHDNHWKHVVSSRQKVCLLNRPVYQMIYIWGEIIRESRSISQKCGCKIYYILRTPQQHYNSVVIMHYKDWAIYHISL